MKFASVVLCGAAAVIAGCANLSYYAQAAQGQYQLLSEAKPIDAWLSDPGVTDKLKDKLSLVKEIRSFAVRELGLPDNESYKDYTDLKRPYVLWNVVATPELSLRPAQSCFPIAGCVDYRGYYDKDQAQLYAAGLRAERYDVQVAGVPAYSTLGWFKDPVLSTFIQSPDGELARMIFHELAHQVAYAPGDTRFNESFATAVEEIGVERWLTTRGEAARVAYRQREERKREFLALLLKTRMALEANYARAIPDTDKRRVKAEIFAGLQNEYQTLKTAWGGFSGYDRWFAEPLTNAHLAAIANYFDYVPAFRALLEREKSLPKFYGAVRELARMEKSERHRRLELQLQCAAHAASGSDAMTC